MVEIEALGKIVGNVGIPVSIVLVLLWLVRTYGPKLIDSHTEFVESVKQQNNKLSDTMDRITSNTERLTSNTERLVTNTEKLTESMLETKRGAGHCKTTTSALLGLCETFEHASEGHAKAEKIKSSLASVRTTLLTGNNQ
jgi:methyl-accepting chemotaxis protein